MNNIKWGMIQPLTGGMYIGARNAIGKPADWIISYPGLTDVKYDKHGNMTSVGNEYHLLNWCKQHNELPNYKIINRKPFDTNMDTDIELLQDNVWSINENIDFSNTDIVLSVPVCSGLSQATIASDETKDARNCNMLWNTKYALSVIKPKIYIFENAPTLYSGKGKSVRELLNNMGSEYGYSVIYYKTDTKYHDNCQRRPRTFVIFVKYNNGTGAPDMQFEHIRTTIIDYFNRIPENASQQITIDLRGENQIALDFIKHKYGANYRSIVSTNSIIDVIINEELWDETYQYINNCSATNEDKDKLISILNRVQRKTEMGKNFYSLIPTWIKFEDETIRTCMFKSIQKLMHYSKDRLLTIREWLHVMGMPHDFELVGNVNDNYPKIGQNVPVRTAQWITSEAVRFITNWNELDRTGDTVKFFDNTKNHE